MPGAYEIEQHPGGKASELVSLMGERGNGHRAGRAVIAVVKAHHRHILRYAQTLGPSPDWQKYEFVLDGGAYEGDADFAIAAEDGTLLVDMATMSTQKGLALGGVEPEDAVLPHICAGLQERGEKALVAFMSPLIVTLQHGGDVPVSLVQQIPGQHPGAARVVIPDAGRPLGYREGGVQEDKGNTQRPQTGKQVQVRQTARTTCSPRRSVRCAR